MPSSKHLRRRIRTVNNTKLITRAMRSVSASKMHRAQEHRGRIKPYAERLQQLVAEMVGSVGGEGQPLMQRRETGRRLIVLFSSDRGLCGSFNHSVHRYAADYADSLSGGFAFYAIGARAQKFLEKQGYPVVRGQRDFRGNIDLPRILEIARDIQDLFLHGGFNEVELIYNQAITAMAYRVKREMFLPLDEQSMLVKAKRDHPPQDRLEYIFEPDPRTILNQILPLYVETQIFYSFTDAFMAEHQARMMAMTTANQNCEELMDALTLQLNKARQTAITTEILEIVGGAEALKG
ncbi:MAG TPA: ATP synthase F1 subunit gamma [bacterium]|nr:ATP synthase F1 subunit gamma [Candidatus Omnitrophota bacterium]HOJ62187.1 ATP synthase F1 subunit gamma [bacterium]HOL95389.1 ATP synthase F1 subunit gamma [bacterium]HPO99604.1 ATP synthase F1 subunit gamma [bacterium]